MGGSVPATLPGEAGTSAFREVEAQSRERLGKPGKAGLAVCRSHTCIYFPACSSAALQ